MIYRAADCGLIDGGEPLTTVWLEATNAVDANTKLFACLRLLWNTNNDLITTGNIRDEKELFNMSTLPDAAGDGRLFETGSVTLEYGYEIPMFLRGEQLIFLPAESRQRLKLALATAQAHARAHRDELTTRAQRPFAHYGAEKHSRDYLYLAAQCDEFARGL
jgi:hypothetical protein